jgi:uncharacterized protein (TIGR02466 family)|tara:strand:+ start:833 stop:1411 length:579 start_codon:yes stop_codon:yes gene_type:complete
MKTQLLFPTVLGFSLNKNHNKIKNKLINYCVDQANTILKGGDNWASKIYNTCGTKEIVSVKEFKVLNDWIFKEVAEYIKELGYTGDIIANSSWFNIYHKHDYQEYHNHDGSDFSAVYFLESEEDSANVIFRSNEPPGIKKVFIKDNPYTWQRFFVPPTPGRLIVFKSNIQHCVEQHKKENRRISLAYNFKIK